ncbi:unnamed protein product [Durusdinium trenchii]
METAFVAPSTGTSSSSSRLLGRGVKTPWRPETQEPRQWAPWIGPGVCLSAALSRRHQRRATAQAETSKPISLKRLPCWGVAVLGFILVMIHRVVLKECRLQLPPPRFTVFLHASIFLILSQFLPPTKFPSEQNVKVILLVGALEFFGWAALQNVVAVAGHLGVSAALLSGVSLLVTLASAKLLLRSHVKATAWIGAAIVALGVGAAGPVHALSMASSPAHVALLCAALFTTSLALTGKEVLFSGRAPLSVASVACLASFAQLLALALPEVLRLHSFPGTLELAQIIVGPAPRIANLSWPAYVYILGSAFLRYTFTWSLRTANAPTVQLVNAVAVPFGSALLMLLSHAPISDQSLCALSICTVGSFIFFLDQGPLMKASELFKGTMSQEQLKLEEAWKQQKAAKAKQAEEERERQAKAAKEKEEQRKKAKELEQQKLLEKEAAQKKEKEEQQKKKEEEQKRKEEERLKAAAEKKKLQEEKQAKKEEERKKAEEERRKKQEEYQRMKAEEEKKAIAEKQRKEEEKKQQEEAKQQKIEADRKAKEEKRKEQERIAEEKKAEEARKREEEKQKKQEEAKQAEEIKKAEEERKLKEKEELKRRQEEEAARKKAEEEEQKRKAEAERKQKQEEELKRKEEEQRVKKEAEERKRKEEEELKRKQAEAQKKKEEEERVRKEAEENKRRQEEERKRQQEQERQRKQEEEKKRKEEEERKRKQEEERKRQEEEEKKRKEEQEKKAKEEEERKKKDEAERKRKDEEETKRKKDEERKVQEEERKQKKEEEQEVVASTSEVDEKEKQKRYSRLSFKWKMQDEMRLGQETAKIKKQLQER